MINHYRRQRLYIQFFIFSTRRIIRRQVIMVMSHVMMTLHSVHLMMVMSHVIMTFHDCTDFEWSRPGDEARLLGEDCRVGGVGEGE